MEERSPSDVPEARRSRTSISAQRLASQLLDDEDREFLDALRRASLLSELDSDELLRVASEVEVGEPESRRVDMLEIYYNANGKAEVSARRRLADRFFLQRVGDPATAASLVTRLAELTPELKTVRLERIGGGDGPLVLRAGEHFSAVLDDYEEETDTDELSLAEMEARKGSVAMVTVRGLVRALNVLLDRHGVRSRLIALGGDERREVYVGLGVSEAIQLATAGLLEDEETEDVMELGAW
ncbi:MAG: hypothetical protein IT378_27180 [Sandaracinaceae bacterium]|nr:hypothetical protein [Sandaracinaceae bacterium]